MVDVTITAASVARGSDAVVEHGTFGATVAQGKVVYLDSADGKYKIADKNSATAAAKVPRGIALNAGSDGQPGTIQRGGDITIGGTLVAGTTYCLSDDGGIAPQADITTGDDVVVLGVAESTTVLRLAIQVSGVTL